MSISTSLAFSGSVKPWVAPSDLAASSLFSSGSIAMTFLAPAYRAPCTACSNGMSSSTLTQDHSDSTDHSENEPTTHMPPRSSPFWWNRKVSSCRQPTPAHLPASHRFCFPVEQYRHLPQTGM